MNIHPHICTHPKYEALEKRLGLSSMHYLVRLWGFCQIDQRGQWLGKRSPLFIESVCGWKGKERMLYDALLECGWIDVDPDTGVCVHDWNDHNAALVVNWMLGAIRKRRAAAKHGIVTGFKDGLPASFVGFERDGSSLNPTDWRAPAPREAHAKPTRSETSGVEMIGDHLTGDDSNGGEKIGKELTGTPHNPPEADLDGSVLPSPHRAGWPECLAYFQKRNESLAPEEPRYTEAEVRSAWLAFEAGRMNPQQWRWGGRPVGDWRSAMEIKINQDREEAAIRQEKNTQGAPSGVELITLEKRKAELQKRYDAGDVPPKERVAIKAEIASINEKLRKAVQS